MKKTLLLCAIFASSFVANATVYKFGSTTGSITTSQLTAVNLVAGTATDSLLVTYNYTAAVVQTPALPAIIATLNISSIPNVQFSYSNSADKTGQIRIYPTALFTNGKSVITTITNVTVGDSLIIATQSKGSTPDIWTVTGANTSSSLNIAGAPASPAVNPVSYIRLIATDVKVVLTETNGGFRLLSLNWFNKTSTGVNQVLTDKGVSFNGTEILNTKGLSLEVYNVLGKKVAASTTSIPTANFQKGVYIVRVSGTNASLKICI